MTIRKTKGIAAAAVFTAASLLHFFIIAAVFLHFSVDRQEPVQTRFVIQSLPVPKAAPAAPAVPQKPQHVQKPALKQPSSVQQERHAEPQEATAAPESSAADAAADSAEPVAEGLHPDVEETGNAAAGNKARILQRIAEKKIYPKAARKHNQEGTVTLSITVLRSGQLARVEIMSPCAYAFLNEAAVASVRAAAPFPLDDTAPEQIEMTVTLEYRLEG